MRILWLATMLLAAASVGCGARQAGWGAQSVGWSETTAGEPEIPGITTASVNFCRYGEGCAAVFWLDGTGSLGAHMDKDRNAVLYDGEVNASDGRSIALECLTSDGKSGTVRIDGQTFDLAKGALFLVSTVDGSTTVEQLRRDVDRLLPDSNSLKADAVNDAAIKQFFQNRANRENER